jgi:hypothetical protein
MVQIIPQDPNPFGRLGAGIGQGLSESIPKEIERYRLSSGLKDLAKNANSLSPLEAYSQAASIPGITPAMLQALPEIIRQQKMGKGLSDFSNQRQDGQGRGGQGNQQNPFQDQNQGQQEQKKGSSSITTTDPIEATTKPYIPPTYDEILSRAGQLYQQNPQLYPTPEAAMKGAQDEASAAQNRNTALQNQRIGEQTVQNSVRDELSKQAQSLGVNIPGTVLSDIQDRAIEDVRSGKYTELQAAKEYGKELDDISRDYKAIENVGVGRLLTRTPQGNKDALKNLQKKFKERDDLENFANTMISENNLSPSKAFYLAYPVSDNKELNNTINSIKDINPKINPKSSLPISTISNEEKELKTLEVAKKIAPKMNKNDSPLAIAEELKSKGYDPRTWMNYISKNSDKLNLSKKQGRELDHNTDFTPTIDDLWMFYFSGLDKLVEQK